MKLHFTIMLILLVGCATTPKPETPVASPPMPEPVPALDISALERALSMDRNKSELGFEEKSFNPCELHVPSNDCRPMFLAVVHFQLQCRDVEGTTENYQVEPINSDHIKWTLGKIAGVTETDREGFGQIRVLTSASQAKQRLRLTLNNDFLILRAADARRIVTPPNWCRRL